jgi:P4 family phage/plasmid primase-like protien
MSVAEIFAGVRLLARHGGVVEARILNTPRGTVSGYFDDAEALARAVARWDGRATIYITANPVSPDLLGRGNNRLREFARETTGDKEIIRRAWFLTDYDPVRPAGIASTAAELAAAIERRNEVVAFLAHLDFPAGVLAMSGNGAHALWPVDLPNDADVTALFERALKALAAKFSDNVVDVDDAVFNAARIWKLYGTIAVKGDATAERPHRRAVVESLPVELVRVERDLLARLAAMAPAGRTTPLRSHSGAGLPSLEPLDILGALRARGLYRRELGRGKHAITCPWHDEHSGDSGISETCVFERSAGEPWGFDCKHAHCSARTIRDLIRFLGLSTRNGHLAAEAHDTTDRRPLELTENALASEFTRRHGEDLRYVHEWGRWLRWDGRRWLVERTLAVFDLSRKLVREVGHTVADRKVAARIESAATVNAIVVLARADRRHARVGEDFDADPWALNTPGGTIDLRSGHIRPHRRADGITKTTPVAPSVTKPSLWMACLQTWTAGDPELVAFLQRFAGYCLTGSTQEEKLPIIYGPGANGKTKFIETLRACLGTDYATSLAMETLMATHGDQHPTDLADLRGKRLAIATETEEGRRLAESKVKMLTGGDRIRARHMRRDFFEFQPTHKIVIFGNYRPALRNIDEAMRRRLLLIPFDATIPPQDRDPKLPEKLARELPAILGWMLAGCRAWLDRGLEAPARVQAATTDYLWSADAISRWLEERCTFGPNESMTKAQAFESWKEWAGANGEYVGSARRLGERIAAMPKVDEARIGKNRDKAFLHVGLRRPDG